VQLRRKMLATIIGSSHNNRQQTGCGGDNSIIAARVVEENNNKKSFVRDDNQTQTSYSYLEELCRELDSNRRKSSSDISHVSNVSWEDVGGLDHVRTEIMDAIELPLKYPRLFPPNVGRSGLLLFGPPGTGKTHVAKAVATECGLPFLSVKGPELLGSYVGESEANIRKIFQLARQAASMNLPNAAAILFFDELDSLAPRRDGVGMNNGGGVMERVVASLLAELDGAHHNNNSNSDSGSGSSEPQGRVFVLGATNRPDLLDPSLLRPGRLDRLVYLGIPTEQNERVRILASQLRKMNLDETEQDSDGNENGNATTASERMARLVVERLPPRLSGADMSKLSSAAMLHALRRLCQEAEQERKLLQQQQQQQQQDNTTDHTHTTPMITVDQLLEKWGEEKCTTVITLEDLYEASKGISPSVSEQEMERYERLRIEHCTTTTTTTTTTKNSTTATSTIPAIL